MELIHHKVYIDVWNCEARIARYVKLENGSFTREFAINSWALEDEAAEAVIDQGGDTTISDHYNITPALASKAAWPSE